jgi:anthranilate phosphoribosyltransferase
MDPVTWALKRLAAGTALTPTESRDAVALLLDGKASSTATAALLTALRVKGETADELDGAVQAVRDRMNAWESRVAHTSLLDTCGTGGDGAGTVNISTAAAIIVAACDIPVVKHGNRAASGISGSAEVLEALGVKPDPDSAVLERSLAELNISFLYAPKFHPGLQRIAGVRRELPFRTVFNLVGPLCNPASPGYQLVGAADLTRAELLANVLARQEHLRRAVVVTGSDGLDEVTLAGPTSIWVIEPGRIERGEWSPEEFGLSRQGAAGLKVRDPGESAERIKQAFAGERGPVRDYLLANSAAAFWTTGRFTLREGVALAAAAIESGAAARLVTRWRELAPATEQGR